MTIGKTRGSRMKRNIILAIISFVGVSFVFVKRKGWKTYLIMLIILGAFLIISGVGGLIVNPFL